MPAVLREPQDGICGGAEWTVLNGVAFVDECELEWMGTVEYCDRRQLVPFVLQKRFGVMLQAPSEVRSCSYRR